MLDTPENKNNEEGKELDRNLVKGIATSQLEALGYRDTLGKFLEWFNNNPLEGFKFSKNTPSEFIEDLRNGLLETYLGELKRIPNKDQARKLVSAALFGIPFSRDNTELVIASYYIEEPSNQSMQTEFDPNRDSKDKIRPIPNKEGTRLLAGRVANTGFIPEGQNPIDVIRKLSWGAKTFEGVYKANPSVKMKIISVNTAYQVLIHKA